jgi:hypothetical protein
MACTRRGHRARPLCPRSASRNDTSDEHGARAGTCRGTRGNTRACATSTVKIAPAVAPAPSAIPRSDESQELRDYCKTASSVRCQHATEKSQGCSQLKSVAFGIHLQVVAFSRAMSLSEARDHAARNAHEVPPDLAQAVANQVTPGTLADSFANDIYRSASHRERRSAMTSGKVCRVAVKEARTQSVQRPAYRKERAPDGREPFEVVQANNE